MKISVRIIIAVAIVGLTVNLIRLRLTAKDKGSDESIIAHTVVLRETVFDARRTPKVGATFTYALRSDGSTALRSFAEGNVQPTAERSIAFADGLRVTADDLREVKMTIMDADRRPARPSPSLDCLARRGDPDRQQRLLRSTVLGYEEVAGYRTVKVLRQGMTTWFGVDLSCAALRRRLGSEQQPTNVQEAASVTPGEPDVALFTVPASYREVPPSEYYRLVPGSKQAVSRDEYYRLHRPAK